MIKTYKDVPTDQGPAEVRIDIAHDLCTILIPSVGRLWELPISLMKVVVQQIEDNEKYGTQSEK